MNILRIALVVLFVQIAGAQQLAPESVQGLVLRFENGEPIARANLELRRVDQAGTPVVTAASHSDGRFVFGNVAPGQYRLTATRTGFVPAEYGQRSANGSGVPITIGGDQRPNDLRLVMIPTGTISGRIADRQGKPMAGIAVQVMKPSFHYGRRIMSVVRSVLTNDLGEYRLFWLAPGRYYVNAIPPDASTGQVSNLILNPGGQIPCCGGFLTWNDVRNLRPAPVRPAGSVAENEAYLPIYFPGTPDSGEATAIDLRAGMDFRGVDITAAAVRTYRVSGVVLNEGQGQPAASVQVQLLSSNPSSTIGYAASRDAQTGLFTFPKVVPGSYIAIANVTNVIGGLSGRNLIEVRNGDVDFSVRLSPGFTVRGRVMIEGATSSSLRLSDIRVGLVSDPPVGTGIEGRKVQDALGISPSLIARTASESVGRDGSFEFANVRNGNYRMVVDLLNNLPLPNAYLKSIRLGIADVLNAGLQLDRQPETALEIVIGTDTVTLDGRVLDNKQQPVPGISVVMVPDSARRLRSDAFKTASTDELGRFRFTGAAPGEYTLLAWEDIEKDAWLDPDFLRMYEDRGKSIHLNEGNASPIDVQLIPII
jgi:5-hydroxyisourate hydrolase-like protein (transthyretin family)